MNKPRAILSAAVLSAVVGVAFGAATAARAQDCPGHPDAIGTSRVITIDPSDYQRLGTLNYQQTLPLADHEVVLTFDDGPLPAPYQPGARYPGVAVRESDVFPGRRNGQSLSRHGAPHSRRRSHDRHAQRGSSAPLRPHIGREGALGDRCGHRQCECGAWRWPAGWRRSSAFRVSGAPTSSKASLPRVRWSCSPPTPWPTTGIAASRRRKSSPAP